jgi:hypothetical protein
MYGEIDHAYGKVGYTAYTRGEEGFNAAQSLMNLVEVAITCVFLFLDSLASPLADLVAFTALIMTGKDIVVQSLPPLNWFRLQDGKPSPTCCLRHSQAG